MHCFQWYPLHRKMATFFSRLGYICFYVDYRGLYACSNPRCSHANYSQSEKLPLGKVISISKEKCECGGRIYELVNHIKCGALYLKVFVQPSNSEGLPYWYVFQNRGLNGDSNSLKEMLLFVVPEDIKKARKTRSAL